MKRECELEEPVALVVEKYATTAPRITPSIQRHAEITSKSMMQGILNSKNLAFVLAAATGMVFYFRVPFPEDNIILQVIVLRSPAAFEVLKYLYALFLFSTPYIGYSVVLSGLYVFVLKAKQLIRAGRLPLFPNPRKTEDLFLVVGEFHNPRKQMPAENPQWLVIPERSLFTGIVVLGAIASGKTSGCMYPFVEQILACGAEGQEKRIGGLVRQLKGDFLHRIQEILAHRSRPEDYVEISLDSRYRCNPLDSKLYAYALAYNIASLLTNLLRQAYTNLVKFITNHDRRRIEPKLCTSIVEEISVFLSLFRDHVSLKRTFCPPPECYGPRANADYKFGRSLPSFKSLMEIGKVCARNFSIAVNAGPAKALGQLMKLDFRCAALSRVPKMEAHPDRRFRQVMFIWDEYQHFATVGESETRDEKSFSPSRHPKFIPIIAIQNNSC